MSCFAIRRERRRLSHWIEAQDDEGIDLAVGPRYFSVAERAVVIAPGAKIQRLRIKWTELIRVEHMSIPGTEDDWISGVMIWRLTTANVDVVIADRFFDPITDIAPRLVARLGAAARAIHYIRRMFLFGVGTPMKRVAYQSTLATSGLGRRGFLR